MPPVRAARTSALVEERGGSIAATRARPPSARHIGATVVFVAALAGCAAPAPREAEVSDAHAAPAAAPAVPELAAYGPFRMQLLGAEDAAGEYWSVVSKATFALAADGSLRLVEPGEPLLDAADAARGDACTAHGAGHNQRTAWFPYTAVFVRGGRLARIEGAGGAALPTRPLGPNAQDGGATVIHTGADARAAEYGFVPCVGAQRVQDGVRLDGYFAAGDALVVASASGAPLRIALPQPFAPFVLARYRNGAMIPVPLRIVVAAVDLDAGRVVLQLQTTLVRSPPLRKLELRAVLPDGGPDASETPARYRERTQALLGDLARCTPPRAHAIEPCADPRRWPDPLIFHAGAAD
jgi:hypothetical protein